VASSAYKCADLILPLIYYPEKTSQIEAPNFEILEIYFSRKTVQHDIREVKNSLFFYVIEVAGGFPLYVGIGGEPNKQRVTGQPPCLRRERSRIHPHELIEKLSSI